MARPPLTERTSPRITANELALYMVSSDTARMGIIRRSKFPNTSPIIRYKHARTAIISYLSDQNRSLNPLVSAISALEQKIQAPSSSALVKDDASHSIDVLHAIQGMGNQLGSIDFRKAPHKQSKLSLGGVEVSVRADLLIFGSYRGQDQVGAAMLRLTMDDTSTDAAIAKRKNMGLYVATLIKLHVEQNISSARTTANRCCTSIDVQHGEVFTAPNSNTRRMNDLDNACKMIAATWPTITD